MHQYFHTTLGFCMWDVLALIVLAVMAVTLIVHIYKQKRRQDGFEKELKEQNNNISSGTGNPSI